MTLLHVCGSNKGTGYAYDVSYCKFAIGPMRKCDVRGEVVSEFRLGLGFYTGLELDLALGLGLGLEFC